jgi:predicted anti-sigma-YlaC factor YlaD
VHNGSTSVAGRRGVSPLRGQRNALGRAALTQVGFSSLRGGRWRPGTLSRKSVQSAAAENGLGGEFSAGAAAAAAAALRRC